VLGHRLATISAGLLALVAAVFLARVIPTEFMGAMDQGELDIAFTMPEGTSIDATFKQGEKIREAIAATVPEVSLMLVTVGAGALQKVNEGKVFVKLPGEKERLRSSNEISAELRDLMGKAFPKTEISVNQASMGGGNDYMIKPLMVQLRGTDPLALRKTAKWLLKEMQAQKGIVDLSLSDRGSRPQYGFQLDRDKVSAAGLSPAQVAMAVRTAVQGSDVSQFRVGAYRYDVVVRAPKEYQESRDLVLSMPLRGQNPFGGLVELGEMVRPMGEDAAAQVDREDRVRQVTIAGNLDGLPLGTAQDLVTKLVDGKLPKGVTMKFAGQGQLMKETFGYMFQALALAIVLIFMVLAAQFESFLHPFTIMVSLPLSLIGALGSLWLFGSTLSMMSFIGIIMLMGLVTKNAILLVDNANQRRTEGLPVREALIEAGAVRLRPILMTTFAMIFGMLPVAMALGEGASFRAPMGIAVIGGLLTSTLLTLLVVPAVSSAVESLRERLARKP
jgi:HAE1 family hydrophobic/amphiphilic exporter-1